MAPSVTHLLDCDESGGPRWQACLHVQVDRCCVVSLQFLQFPGPTLLPRRHQPLVVVLLEARQLRVALAAR